MNSLKFKFFFIFILLGLAIAVIGYVPYMNYISYSYKTSMNQLLANVEAQYPVLRDIDHIVSLGETTYNKAISGEYGEEIRDKIVEFETLNHTLYNLRKAFNLEFVSYMKALPNNEYCYVLSSDFSYKWLESWGLNDLLYPAYTGEELGPAAGLAVTSKSFQMAESSISQASWGTIVPAFLPITNEAGAVVGIVEADYRLETVLNFRRNALLVLGGSILLAALASILLSMYVSHTIVTPVKQLKQMADALANKDFSVNIFQFRKDEIGEMQRSMVTTRDNLRRALFELQEERDEITAMKDNLKTGVFLINSDSVIQANYSASMEAIFALKNLSGLSFISLLRASLNETEITSISDFFEMIIEKGLKQKKIDNLNPLAEFKYIHPETKAEKTLRCGFARIQREGSGVFILGTVEDITAEMKLKKRLVDEEKIKTEQMRLLFEIVNLEQSLLKSFLSDVEYNFDKIIDLQKNRGKNPRNMLMDMYQVVHATKSDAAILGISVFADKLHLVESEIKRLLDLKNIEFSQLLRFTIDIEQMMQEKDKIHNIVNKIGTAKPEARLDGESGRLEEALSRAAQRVAGDLSKKIEFVNEGIDAEAYEKAPRRELKDILVQVVRNAVYHGIETPEERAAAGKPEAGRISLGVKAENNMLHSVLGDDGRGLDGEKIRAKALEKGIIAENSDIDDKKVLEAIFEPAFSTADSEGMHAGRGIGLNLVRDRVRKLNGSVKVQSKKGKGTVFNIYLPLSEVPQNGAE